MQTKYDAIVHKLTEVDEPVLDAIITLLDVKAGKPPSVRYIDVNPDGSEMTEADMRSFGAELDRRVDGMDRTGGIPAGESIAKARSWIAGTK